MSFHKPPDAKPEDPTYVSISDEAFLVTLWENYYDRWVYMHKKRQLEAKKDEESNSGSTGKGGKRKKSSASVKENQDPKAAGKGKKGSRSDGEDEESEKDEDPEKGGRNKDPVDPNGKGNPATQLVEVKCPYTKPQGGVQRFGGWNNKGRKRFNDLVAMIEANRRDRKKYLLEVETEALQRIRAFHGCDAREVLMVVHFSFIRDGISLVVNCFKLNFTFLDITIDRLVGLNIRCTSPAWSSEGPK